MKTLPVIAFGLISAAAFAQNPIISNMYTPDPAPFVHDGKVYLFTDHDEDDATYFLMKENWANGGRKELMTRPGALES